MDATTRDFQEIYEDYHPKILRYMTRLVGEDEAEDLTQDVFIKASLALPDFRGESSLSTWLYRIATNRAYDRMRSSDFRRTAQTWQWDAATEEEVEEIADCNPCTGDKTSPVEQLYVKNELSECILSYVDRLPESYRTVILLSGLEELSNNEIAEILGITVEAVKTRLHRARAQLIDLFMDHCEYYWVSELSWRAV